MSSDSDYWLIELSADLGRREYRPRDASDPFWRKTEPDQAAPCRCERRGLLVEDDAGPRCFACGRCVPAGR